MRDVLDGLSLSKDVQDIIMAEYGKNIRDLKQEKEQLEKDNKKLQEQVDKVPDLDQIKKEQFDLGKAEGSKELDDYKKSIALQEALNNTKAKDKALLSKLVDNDKISYELKDGKYEVKGLSEQIEDIKKSHDYLFEIEKENKTEKRFSTGESHKNSANTNTTMSLNEALKEKIEN